MQFKIKGHYSEKEYYIYRLPTLLWLSSHKNIKNIDITFYIDDIEELFI